MPKDTIENLNKVLVRLTDENSQWRDKNEKVNVVLRRRAPNASGLSPESALETILDERDDSLERIQFFRNELKSILKYLINSYTDDSTKVNELKKRINYFLQKNTK